jgi:hypothetical protein
MILFGIDISSYFNIVTKMTVANMLPDISNLTRISKALAMLGAC